MCYTFIYLVLIALMASPGFAVVERRGWMYEQWNANPLPTGFGASRSQAWAHMVNYADSLSFQGAGLLDLKEMEITLKGSQRVFLSIFPEGKYLQQVLSNEVSSVGLGLARFFSTDDGHYGRLGLEYFQSFPGSVRWARLAVEGGVLESPQLPWFIAVDINYLLHLSKDQSNYFAVRGRSGKVFSLESGNTIRLGGFLWWTYRMRDIGQITGTVYEHMIFSLGPFVSYRTSFGELSLDLLFRLWLDQENIITATDGAGNPIINTGYPSEFGPSLALKFTHVF